MRIRRLIAAGFLLAAPLTVAAASAAAADTTPNPLIQPRTTAGAINFTVPANAELGDCKGEEVQAIADAVAAKDQTKVNQLVEDCFSAPSPVVPKVSEIFWGGLAWLIVMIIVVKVGVPAIKKTMQARSDKIKGDLEAAEASKASAAAELDEYRRQLADANAESARIVDEARQQAEAVRKDIVARAEQEAADIRVRANDEVRIASDRAMADLRQQVAAMSVDLAGKIVEKNLDPATQQSLIDSYISSVGSN